MSWLGAAPADAVKCHMQDTRWGLINLCRYVVGALYSPNLQERANEELYEGIS